MKIQGGVFYMCKLSRRYTVHTISLIIGALNTIQDFYEERTSNDVFTMVSSWLKCPVLSNSFVMGWDLRNCLQTSVAEGLSPPLPTPTPTGNCNACTERYRSLHKGLCETLPIWRCSVYCENNNENKCAYVRNLHTRARICEHLRSPGIDSASLCTVAWRTGIIGQIRLS
jgi:hypothetical protein